MQFIFVIGKEERDGLKKFPDLTNKIESIMAWRCWASIEVETKVPQLMFQKCGRFMNPASVGLLQRFTQGIIKTLSTINDKSLQGVNAWHLAELCRVLFHTPVFPTEICGNLDGNQRLLRVKCQIFESVE